MTADQLAQMSDEEKRVALAKFMGIEMLRVFRFWCDNDRRNGICLIHSREEAEERRAIAVSNCIKFGNPIEGFSEIEEYDSHKVLPDYLNSLDAVAEVEAKLSDEQHASFGNTLQQMIYDKLEPTLTEGPYHYHPVTRAFISATARQRADAILMIL